MSNLSASYRNIVSNSMLTGFSMLLLLSFLSMSSIQTNNLIASVDVDTDGDSRAAAFDGGESIATDGDSFCSITDDIVGGKLSSLFEGIVGDCDNDNSQSSNQFLVEYSYTKNPVKIGEKSYFTVNVKDKNSGNPISNAFVTLGINSQSSTSFETSSSGAAVAAAGISSNQEVEKDRATQTMYTDNNGRATFTVGIGPKSDLGIYDTELEVTKYSYQSSFEEVDLRVV
jgi:hypothetical protein